MILGSILELINIAGIVLLTVFLSRLAILPGIYLAAVYGVLLLLTVGSAFLLLRRKKRKAWYVLGALAVCVSIGLTAAANYYLYHSLTALGAVTSQVEQKTVMGVYVRAEEDISDVEECVGLPFGIISEQERERTDQALAMIEQELGEGVET